MASSSCGAGLARSGPGSGSDSGSGSGSGSEAAPRDFHISSCSAAESRALARCALCAAARRAFYCAGCLAAGACTHSDLPYGERFADKQLKLYRLKANRKYVKDRCETLLLGKSKQERLRIDANQCKEKIALLKLAIEQTKQNTEERKLQLSALVRYNGELQVKLPRYQKRVSSLEKHATGQKAELQDKMCICNEKAQSLAALRRARLRQLMKYIFPVHLTYDARESFDADDEFLHDVKVVEQPDKMRNVNLHIVAPWLPANGDFSKYNQWVSSHKDAAAGGGSGAPTQLPEGAQHPVYRISAGLSLAAQLTALTAAYLNVRLPYNLNFSDYSSDSLSDSALNARVRRLTACVVWVGLHARRPPPPEHKHALTILHALYTAVATDDHRVGRVEQCLSSEMVSAAETWASAWAAEGDFSDDEEPEPPEHLIWDNTEEISVISSSPPQPVPASLMTSAAASIASLWRGWTAK